MTTTKSTISEWFDRGKKERATHMIVVCDSFNHSNYPVFVKPGEDVYKEADQFNNKNKQRIMEVYHLGSDKEFQLNQYRAFNYEPVEPLTKSKPTKPLVKLNKTRAALLNKPLVKLNKAQAALLTHVVCEGEDYAHSHSEKTAATQLEKLGFTTVKKWKKHDKDLPHLPPQMVYKVKATEAGKKRILG